MGFGMLPFVLVLLSRTLLLPHIKFPFAKERLGNILTTEENQCQTSMVPSMQVLLARPGLDFWVTHSVLGDLWETT